MLKRKIESVLVEWKSSKSKKPLVIKGIRQCGKTYIVRKFAKDSGLELDFLTRFKGECVVLEVKSKSGKTKSLNTVLKNKNIYHINNAIKLGKYNVGRERETLTIPLYMGFLIKDKLSEIIVPDVDLREFL